MSSLIDKLEDFSEIEGEEWRGVSYLPRDIEVSSMGRIRRYITQSDVKIMRPTINNGYAHFSVMGNSYILHRVIADVFIPNPEKLPFVKHKNGIQDDNRVENLEWSNPQANLTKGYSQKTDSRKKLYCEDLDQVFGSLRSAAYILDIPQDVLSEGIKENKPVIGHIFRYLSSDDPIVSSHNLYYIAFETVVKFSNTAKTKEEFKKMIQDEVGEGIT